MSIIEQLGIDVETATWEDFSLCKGAEISWFFDDYENDKTLAANVDQICIHCPVAAFCYNNGKSQKEYGVWGGVYLDGAGHIDRPKNEHKTKEDWELLEQRTQAKLKR
jgi:hypothetical protein